MYPHHDKQKLPSTVKRIALTKVVRKDKPTSFLIKTDVYSTSQYHLRNLHHTHLQYEHWLLTPHRNDTSTDYLDLSGNTIHDVHILGSSAATPKVEAGTTTGRNQVYGYTTNTSVLPW
jgi:hypothetical protein